MPQCEAEIITEFGRTQCPNAADHVHHMLTRARGGMILDNAGETYHVINLCHRCHDAAHRDPLTGLVIDGYVTTDQFGQPRYTGSDPYLRSKYGFRFDEDDQGSEEPEDRDASSGEIPGEERS